MSASDEAMATRPALSGRAIFIRYVLFAVVAGLANLATQELVVRAAPHAPIMASVLAGTIIGFVLKYLLDKRFVFLDGYDGHVEEVRKVAVYGAFSVATTLVFWAVELAFWYGFGTSAAKYTGAVIGLALGNYAKYRLDRRFVFRRVPQ